MPTELVMERTGQNINISKPQTLNQNHLVLFTLEMRKMKLKLIGQGFLERRFVMRLELHLRYMLVI